MPPGIANDADSAARQTLGLLRREKGKKTDPQITRFGTSQGASGLRLYPAHEVEENQFITIYAFKLDEKRAVTFVCWPSLGDKKNLLPLYDEIIRTFVLTPQ